MMSSNGSLARSAGMTERRLIINADDLGLTPEVSLGIEQSFQTGVVSSASLMANMPGFDAGVQVALRNPGLGIGVHLNLIRGLPLSTEDTVLPLLNPGGKFIDNIFHIGQRSANPDYQIAAEIEYRAQIERILDSGVRPDHLDFEKHHGIWQDLYTIGIRLAKEYKLAIRCYHEPLFWVMENLPFAGYRNLWRSLHLRIYNTLFHRKLDGVMPDFFFGQTHIGRIDKSYLLALFSNLPPGTSELMTHPGFIIPKPQLTSELGTSWITESRQAELEALTDPAVKDALTASKIKLTTFKEGLLVK